MDLENIIGSKHPTFRDLDIDSDDINFQKEIRKLGVKKLGSDIEDRKWLAKWSACIVTIWLVVVITILVTNNYYSLYLSDAVLITLLGTTTLNILGLSFIVLRGHFSSSQKK